MISQILYRDIYLIPILCGVFAQLLKVLLYSLVARRFIPGRLFQHDGMPNLHATVFGSLSAAVALKYGISSILFSATSAFSIIIMHDTMRVKREKEKQVDVLNKILTSISEQDGNYSERINRVLQFRPLDVICGAALGILLTYFAI